MNKFGRRAGGALAGGALAAEILTGCSSNAIDYLKPSVACAGIEIKLNGTEAAERTKAIASAVLACYNKLPLGINTETGEANSISVRFPVAGGEVVFRALSEAALSSDPATYIDHVRDVSVATYQVASAKDKTQLDDAGINTYDSPLYMWATSKGVGGVYQDVRSGVQDDTKVPYLSARTGDTYDSSFDPRVLDCAEESITHDIVDAFHAVTSQSDQQSLPQIPVPNITCGKEV